MFYNDKNDARARGREIQYRPPITVKDIQTTMPHCPICQKPSTEASRPFCSPRCREVDLNKWFTGSYAVPAVELDDVDDESLAAAAELLATPEDGGS